MATRWFYSNIQPSGGTSGGRAIRSTLNKMITQPIEYNGVLYGTKDNPIYQVGMTYGIISDTYWNYYIDSDTNIGGSPDTRHVYARYTGYVGILEGGVDRLNYESSYTEDYGGNKPLSGRWRTKDVWKQGAHGGYFLIPVVHTLTLKDGTVYTSNEIGSKGFNTYPYLNIGGIDIGVNTGRDYTVAENYKDMVIDFGDIPQDCPATFYDYIATCFNYIYPNTYIIKSPNGEILAQENEQPAIKKTNLIWAGDSYQLSLTREDDVVETMTWSYETPEGKTFIGLGTSPNGSVVIPVGENDISITDSFTLYPVFVPYRVNPETFVLQLYQNTAEHNRVDKTNYLTIVGTLEGVMRDASSLTDLTVTLQLGDIPIFNYIYIPKFERYYYVEDIRLVRTNLYEIDMTVDALMSYKDAIKGLRAFVDRNENTTNPYLIDKKRVIEQGVDIEEQLVGNSIPFITDNDDVTHMNIYILNGYKVKVEYVEE